ncbi:MAG: hypothetical protein GXP62_00505 [Oligoflexia bacterium]|nr:hypothetical protein [Oligoflexia bacterium]
MILVVSAVAEELGDLPGRTVGIGPVVAAAATARILVSSHPDAVLLIGTAGSYRGGPPIGQVCVARRVGLTDGAAVMGLGYVPQPPPPIPCDSRLLARCDLPQHDVLTSCVITTDPLLANRWRTAGRSNISRPTAWRAPVLALTCPSWRSWASPIWSAPTPTCSGSLTATRPRTRRAGRRPPCWGTSSSSRTRRSWRLSRLPAYSQRTSTPRSPRVHRHPARPARPNCLGPGRLAVVL